MAVQLKIAEMSARSTLLSLRQQKKRRSFATARDNSTGMTMETRTLLRGRDFTYAMRMLRDAMDSLDRDQRLENQPDG